MKIESIDNQLTFKEVYNSITLETKEGNQLHICMRDFGFEMKLNGGKWHLIQTEDDFKDNTPKINLDVNINNPLPTVVNDNGNLSVI